MLRAALVLAVACRHEPAAQSDPFAPTLVTYASGLSGYLYRPTGKGPFPAIVFNHGSEQDPGTKRGQALFYVPHGFVLFVPHRRGQGLSAAAGPSINSIDVSSPAFVDALVAQTDDVMAAVAYVASLPDVDPSEVATVGCSLGGIESLFAAERGTGLTGAVDFAGAAITWARNESLQERMKLAARTAKIPVFFVQAENDYDTTPSRVLAAEMRAPHRVHIYPPNGQTAQEGHGFCIGGKQPPWGDEVLEFLGAAH
jgi:dienelactone hydrolase